MSKAIVREAFQGELVGIFIAPRHGQTMMSVDQVEALAGVGLAGDRHALERRGKRGEGHVTLIEAETLWAAARDYQVNLELAETRRNLLTRGVPLNYLVNIAFRVGPAVLMGFELCEPCGHLAKLTGKPVLKVLRHRGGLRCRILTGGTLRVGDSIMPGDT